MGKNKANEPKRIDRLKISRFKDGKRWGYFIVVTPPEAMALIRSLAGQFEGGHLNSRLESFSDDGEYFSICVQDASAVREYRGVIAEKERIAAHRKWIEEREQAWRRRSKGDRR